MCNYAKLILLKYEFLTSQKGGFYFVIKGNHQGMFNNSFLDTEK